MKDRSLPQFVCVSQPRPSPSSAVDSTRGNTRMMIMAATIIQQPKNKKKKNLRHNLWIFEIEIYDHKFRENFALITVTLALVGDWGTRQRSRWPYRGVIWLLCYPRNRTNRRRKKDPQSGVRLKGLVFCGKVAGKVKEEEEITIALVGIKAHLLVPPVSKQEEHRRNERWTFQMDCKSVHPEDPFCFCCHPPFAEDWMVVSAEYYLW